MKKFMSGFIGGLLAACLIVPTFADDFELLFNQVRICVDGNTKTNWDENIKDTDMPSSITYKDTTYVPLRWISDNLDKHVAWNGDSRTVSITQKDGENVTLITEQPDLNGNMWKYYVTDTKYLKVVDEKRGFERRYRLHSTDSYKLEEDAIVFVMVNPDKYDAAMYRLYFSNDENSQDGTRLTNITPLGFVFSHFDEQFLYTVESDWGTGAHDYIEVYDMNGISIDSYHAYRGVDISGITVKSSNEMETVFAFNLTGYKIKDICEITFDKTSKQFKELVVLEQIRN